MAIKTIFVIDDDIANLKTIHMMLADNYNVSTANSGELAFKYLERFIPDLILLDFMMPKMDGIKFINKLKSNEAWKNIPVIFITADSSSSMEAMCLSMGAVDFIGKPFEPNVMNNRVKRTLELASYQNDLETAIKEQAEEIEKQNIRIVEIQEEVIVGMASLIESRDGSTGLHVKRTAQYVNVIINELKRRKMFADILTDEYINNVCKATPLHDVGKIGISDSILQKPGALTPEEFEVMKTHTTLGGKIVKEILSKIENKNYIKIAYNIAMYHHEKWNGKGYNSGLKGNEIPLEARIMSIADVFDAVSSKRCYKEAMSIDESFKVIEDSIGTSFDPEIGRVFMESRRKIEKLMY